MKKIIIGLILILLSQSNIDNIGNDISRIVKINEYKMYHEGWQYAVSDVEMNKPKTITSKVTGYSPFDDVNGLNSENPENPITSTGKIPSSLWCAVDPAKIEYGTLIYVPNYGFTTAGDTGGALRSYSKYQVDLYFDTFDEAVEWGRQYVEITIYN